MGDWFGAPLRVPARGGAAVLWLGAVLWLVAVLWCAVGAPAVVWGRAVDEVRVQVRRLEHYPEDWDLPGYATPGSAAVDLRNAGPAVTLPPGGRALVPTGLAIALPEGVEAQVRPRSGLAIKRGLGLINAPGTIDSDYRGEVRVPVINHDGSPQTLEHGERIAQMVVSRVGRIRWSESESLPETERGSGGFGSTGRR